MSIGAGQVTRFGIGGQIWRPAGSFAGKLSPPVFAGTIPTILGIKGRSNVVTDLSTYFTSATSYSIALGLSSNLALQAAATTIETGWTFDTGTGILTVDTDVIGTFGTYVITGISAGGTDTSNAFRVVISAAPVTGMFKPMWT